MAVLANAEKLVKELKAAVETDRAPFAKSKTLVSQFKLLLTQLPSLHTVSTNEVQQKKEVGVAREGMELAAIVSVKLQDGSFDKNYAQLRNLCDFKINGETLPPSPTRTHIVGINLMHLLVENRLSEFHSECELLSMADRAVPYIRFPIELEQQIMEGAYSKVLDLSHHQPSPYYTHFMESLMETVRGDIAECAEKSYDSLSLGEAQKMFMMPTKDLLMFYVNRKLESGWRVEGNNLVFKVVKKSQVQIPALKLVAQTLEYAQEIERIV